MTKYVGAVDQGTTSTRFMIFDKNGQVVGYDQKEFRQIYPKPGWVEHDPKEIWQTTEEVIAGALRKTGLTTKDLVAVGVTNQRETTTLWDRYTGEPVYNAQVWQDTRTGDVVGALAKNGGQDRFRPQTGLPLTTYFSNTKIMWVLDNVPGVRARAEKGDILFGTIDTWEIWNLTGGTKGGLHITDVSNASRTQLLNLYTLDWDDEILAALNIPKNILPKVVPSSQYYGVCTGLLEGVPVAGDLGDQQAAIFGQACYDVGDAKNTYGTACCMLLNTGTQPAPSKHGLLTTVGYKIGDGPAYYCLEGAIAIGGAVVQWLRDNLQIIEKSSDVESLAASVEDNGGIYFVPAFSGLFAPHWKTDARGVIAGMTRYVNKAHIARAALESTVYQTKDVLDAMNKDWPVKMTSLKVDGGMVYNNLLMQFQADMLGIPVIRPKIAETTALGAAYAAGLACDYWKDTNELREYWQKDMEWQPKMSHEESEKLFKGWQKALTRTYAWVD